MTLRAHLVLLVAAAGLPLAILSAILVVRLASQPGAAVAGDLREMAGMLSAATDTELERAMATLQTLGATAQLASDDLRAFHATALQTLEGRAHWYTIALLDPSGKRLVDARAPFGPTLPAWPEGSSLASRLASGRPAVSELFEGGRPRRPLVAVAVPVRRDDRLKYMLAASVEPSILTDILARPGLPAGALVTIVDRSGTVIASTRALDRFAGRPTSDPRGSAQPPMPRWASQISDLGTGWIEGVDPDGVRSHAVSFRSSLSGWAVVLVMSGASIDTPAQRAIWIATGAGALCLLLAIGLAAVVGRRIAGPVPLLSAAASALARDRALVPIPASPVKEVQDLTRTLGAVDALLQRRRLEQGRAEERGDQLEADLRRAKEARYEFLAMLGHELRNPLGALTTAAAALQAAGAPHDQHGRLQEIISRQTEHLARIVENLLDVSQLTFGKIVLDRERVDVRDVAKDTIAALVGCGKADRREISLTGQSVTVSGDPTRLRQVVWNLLDNAVKSTPSGRPISVIVERESQEAVLRVRDSGRGIAPDLLPRVFDLFVQGRQPSDRAEGGLGVGLAVVKRLVALHGGSVSAHSAGPGQGSEFIVRLPRIEASPAADSHRTALRTTPPRHVLVIEDHRDARAGLCSLLESWGHRVETAEDGAQGLQALLASRPEIALIDIGLPGLDGYGIARAVRAAPGGDRICLVALTGYGQPEDRRRALEAGFDAHLVKPVEPAEVLAVLARARAEVPGVSL